MLTGNISGQLHWIRNEGSPTAFKFGSRRPLMAGGGPAKVAGGDAHPVVVDWDGDRVIDLLVGTGDGGVTFFKGSREGSSGAPALLPGKRLEAGGKPIKLGTRLKLCVTDWNDDGKLDLLAGNFDTVEKKPSRQVGASRTGTERPSMSYVGNVYVMLGQNATARASR
jgi:hypothetical protein